MPPLSARDVALSALRAWRTSRRSADAIFGELVGRAGFISPDRAFVLELFYGVLRNLTLLDFWIGTLRPGEIESELRDVLRLGLYQLLIANVREHAAVFETVELAPRRGRGFVNAILREALRQRPRLESATNEQPLSVRTSHPEFLIRRWEAQFGAEMTSRLCAWNNEPPKVYGRINQLKIGMDEFKRNHPEAKAVAGSNNFVEFPLVFPSAALESGECYIQDPSTRLACEILAAQPGDRVLDACAAPGGKTGYIAEAMGNEGAICAVDRQSTRLTVLKENLERLGVTISTAIRHDWLRDKIPPEIQKAAPFDRILLDAPCSNTGVMRRRVDVRWRLRPNEFSRMQAQQLAMICAIAPFLRKNGALVYSTCSLEPEENSELVRVFLAQAPEFELVEEQSCSPFRDGFDGAYVAKLTRSGSALLQGRHTMES